MPVSKEADDVILVWIPVPRRTTRKKSSALHSLPKIPVTAVPCACLLIHLRECEMRNRKDEGDGKDRD